MNVAQKALVAFVCCAGLAGATLSASAAGVAGNYVRPNGDKVKAAVIGGKLYCKIVSGKQAGFEMCHGMKKTGANIWQGSAMKHPAMTLMTFNGTVTVHAHGLTIKGCAVGQSMCQSENWKRD